jgi:hypothetical protein
MPGIEKIVEHNMKMASSPLDEILNRQQIISNDINIDNLTITDAQEKEGNENIDGQIE